jgi:hypothetical protein
LPYSISLNTLGQGNLARARKEAFPLSINTLPLESNLWPYDEVALFRESEDPCHFQIKTPWLKIPLRVLPEDSERVAKLSGQLGTESLTYEYLHEVNWLFGALTRYPLTYLLPRQEIPGSDLHRSFGQLALESTPWEMLEQLSAPSWHRMMESSSLEKIRHTPWTWDHEAAIEFSLCSSGVDPMSLFSVARRFHLLNDLEWNCTKDLLELIEAQKGNATLFNSSSALMIRQNHYITQACESVLSAGKMLAQTALPQLEEFISAESGHHKILEKALVSLRPESQIEQPLPSTYAIMEVFRETGRLNFLAFAMITDIFERSSFQKEDPFASVLKKGGQIVAHRQLESHRHINDQGNHENVALTFLNSMGAVEKTYAMEALRLAELATLVIHQISAETIFAIGKHASRTTEKASHSLTNTSPQI